MKRFKYSMLIALVLAIVVALAIGVKAYAKTMKAPEGKLQYYRFSRGGGMNPFDFTIYYLRQDEKTGKPLLTVSGDCDGEVITFNVEQEVFTRCAEIIKEYKLYLSKGHYKERFMVLDAPSSSFHLSFEDSKESVYGSGDWPQRINDGVKAVNGYLMSLVGDRKAEGHVDRIYQGTDLPGMHWTDGIVSLTTTDKDATELKRYLRGLSDADKAKERLDGMGFGRYHEGNQHYIIIYDYNYRKCRLFYSFDGREETRKQMVKQQLAALKANKPTENEQWPIVNERFLSHPMLSQLSEKQLQEMAESIRLEKCEFNGGLSRMTDIGEVNHQLLESEQKRFNPKEQE